MGRWVANVRVPITIAIVSALLVTVTAYPRAVTAQQSDDESRLEELAARLLGFAPPGASAGSTRAQLYPGTLPPALPFDVPLPPDSTLIGSAVRPLPAFGSQPPGSERIDIVLDVPGAVDAVTAFYRDTFVPLGWFSPMPPTGLQPGGFLPSGIGSPPQGVTLCQAPTGPWFNVTANSMPDGPNDVRIVIETQGAGPCAPQGPGGPPPLPPVANLLPPLTAPPDVLVSPRGGGGGNGVWSSTATATAAISAAALEESYAEQLVAAGWTRTAGGADDAVAWSTWRLPGEGDWRGLLYIQAEPNDRARLLYVQVASLSQQGGGGLIVAPR